MRDRLTRRTFVGGLAGLLVGGSGLVPRARRAWAAPGDPEAPRRLIVVFTPCGVVPGTRLVADTGDADAPASLGPALLPLERHHQRLLFLDGIDLATAALGPGDPHQKGIAHLLTGMPIAEGALFAPFDRGDRTSGWGTGISIDQVIASEVGATSWLPSLHLGVDTFTREVLDLNGTMVYRGPGAPVAPDNDPRRVFRRLFGAGAGQDTPARRARRLRALDAARGDLEELRTLVGGAGRAQLDHHLELVRGLERRFETIGASVATGPGCAPGIPPEIPPWGHGERYETLGEAQMDLTVAALACDRTRVVTLQWSRAASTQRFAGAPMDHHALTHAEQTDAVIAARLDIDRGYADRFAGLLDRLAATPDGDGTLLDHSLVVWINEMHEPYDHTSSPLPVVLAGGLVRTGGRIVRYQGAPHNDLLVTIAQRMGLQGLERFGHPDFSRGPLTGLV